MITLGAKEVTKVMKGSQEITTAYKGSDKVWPYRRQFAHSSAYFPSNTSGTSRGLLVSDFTLDGMWSIDFWIKLTASPGLMMIFDTRFNTPDQYPTLYFENSELRLSLSTTTKLNFGRIYQSFGNTWVHVAAINDGGWNRAYLNGVFIGQNNRENYTAANNAFLGSSIAEAALRNAYLQDFRLCAGITDKNDLIGGVPTTRATATPGCKILMFTGDDDYSTFWNNKAPGGGNTTPLVNATSSGLDATDPSNRILRLEPEEIYNTGHTPTDDNDVDLGEAR
jgi:hypothetical protein